MIEQYSVYIAAILFLAAISFTWKVNQRVDNLTDDLTTLREEFARLEGLMAGMRFGDDDN